MHNRYLKWVQTIGQLIHQRGLQIMRYIHSNITYFTHSQPKFLQEGRCNHKNLFKKKFCKVNIYKTNIFVENSQYKIKYISGTNVIQGR